MHGGTIIILTYPVDYLPVYFREIFFTCRAKDILMFFMFFLM